MPRNTKANQSNLARLLFEEDRRFEQFRQQKMPDTGYHDMLRAREKAHNRLSRDLETCRRPLFVFSAEDLSAPDFPESSVQKAIDFFRGFSDDIHVIAYVRPPLSFMTSAYAQRLKEQKKSALEISPDTLWPNYRDRFEKYEHILGRARVALHSFARETLIDGNVVTDFLNRIGCTKPPRKLIATANESLSAPAMSLAYLKLLVSQDDRAEGRIFDEQAARLNACGIPALKQISGTRFRLSESLLRPVMEKNRADFSWISERVDFPPEHQPTAEGFSSEAQILDYAVEHIGKLQEALDDQHAKRPGSLHALLLKLKNKIRRRQI